MTKRPRNPTKQGTCVRIEDSFATAQESRRSDFGASRKAPKTKGCAAESSNRRRETGPGSSPGRSSVMGGRPPLHSQRWGGRLSDPPGQGTPWRVPDQPFSTIVLYVLPSLEGQTISESDETKFTMCVSKIASQRFKNRIDPTSVLRE